MPNLPSANLQIKEAAGAFAAGTDLVVVMACVVQSYDLVPRPMSSTQDILSQYLYSQGADYCASHFAETGKSVVFLGLPIAVAGTHGSENNTDVTGTCSITVTAASGGIMEQVAGVLTVVQGTNVGTDQIIFDLSCDDGETSNRVLLGTATTYTIPNFGIVLNFGSGTLNAGDAFTFLTTAPLYNGSSITSARNALAAQEDLQRSWIVIGESTPALAADVLAEANNYETENERFVYARVNAPDVNPLADKSQVNFKMTTFTSVTFAATGHTITRVGGSFVTDGFAVGQVVTIAGTTDNNGVIGVLTGVSATVLTFASGVVNEGPLTSGVSISGSEGLVFAAGDTITRSTGSWLNDGFAIGMTVAITGSASNNVSAVITNLSATVLTASATTFTSETASSSSVTVTEVETYVGFVTAQGAAFSGIDAAKRIDISIGRTRKTSEISGCVFRRPASWVASIREFQHDIQVPTYEKDLGPLDNCSLADANGNIVEYDERTEGAALPGRFTCLRTYANGPRGCFVALSLTRDTEGAILSRTQNASVANLAAAVIQAETENQVGAVLELNPDGTGTDASLALIEQKVNDQLQINLLGQFDEGPRASQATWSASRTDDLAPVGATLHGKGQLGLDGTLEQIDTVLTVS